jgi:hypothetical protein
MKREDDVILAWWLVTYMNAHMSANGDLRPTIRRGILERPTFCTGLLGKLAVRR